MKLSMVVLLKSALILGLALAGCGESQERSTQNDRDDFNIADDSNDDDDRWESKIVDSVTATQGQDPESVTVQWESVDGVDGYVVHRDGTDIYEGGPEATEYVDEEADAPGEPGDIYDVEASDDRGDGVLLSWDIDGGEPGGEHEYTVAVVVDDEVGPKSDPAIGYRGAYGVEFEIRREDDEDWRDVGTGFEYLDEDAPFGEIIDAGQVRATKGEYLDRVYLSIDDLEITEGPERSYEIRVSADHDVDPAPPVTGNRGIADPDVQWQRSNTNEPTGFADVSGAASAPYGDTSAPAGGMLRYYRAQLWFPGDDPVMSEDDYGFRALDCPVDAGFEGQFDDWDGQDPPAELGGEVPTNDASLDALWSAVNPAANFEDAQSLSPSITVDGATVIATSFRENRQFWLQDSQTSIQVYLEDEVTPDVEVGQKVSFQATEMDVFNGNPQVSDVENFSVDSDEHPVAFADIRTEPIELDDHYYRLVRVGGVLENPELCSGDYTCFDLTYGPYGDRQSIPLRSSSENAADGECLTFVGPAIAYPGEKTTLPDDPAIQLQTDSYRWTSWGL